MEKPTAKEQIEVLEIGAKWKGGCPETMLDPRFSVPLLSYSTPLQVTQFTHLQFLHL